jgi:antitoxin VapB
MDNSSLNRLAEARATFNLDGAPGMASNLRGGEVKHYRAKVFKSGNSLALRLPAALGLEAGMEMELTVGPDGAYTLKRIEPPKQKLDISGFWGKCPWLEPLPRELREFEERPSTIAARKAAEGKS